MGFVQKDNVAPLSNWSDEQFRAWFSNGMRGYFILGKGRQAFSPMQTYVGLEPHITEDLAEIFVLLPKETQEAFRRGLIAAFTELLDSKDANRQLIEGYILLMQGVEATGARDAILEMLLMMGNRTFLDAQTILLHTLRIWRHKEKQQTPA